MPITFPTPTTIGQQFASGGKTWQWNGYAWDAITLTPVGATGATGPIQNVTTDTTSVNAIRAITQAEYDAISPKNPNTIYFIKQ